MRILSRFLLFGALAICLTAAASAATITFTSAGTTSDGTYSISPYTITVDGVTYEAMCYDYSDTVYVGETWTATLYELDDLAGSYFSSQADYTTKYAEAAWLFSQLLSATTSAEATAIQHAAWSLFSTTASDKYTTGSGSEAVLEWLKAAAANYSSLDTSTYRVVESVSGSSTKVQGLLIVGYSVPEPGTCMLMGSGLVLFAAAFRRRRRQ